MSRGIRFWSFSSKVSVYNALVLIASMPSALMAQSLTVSPRAAVMGGQAFAVSLGVRMDVGSSRFGVYGHAGRLGVTQTCETSLPPTCTSPSNGGIELSGGARVGFPEFGVVYPVFSAGAGAFIWGDDEPYESEVGLLLDLELGARIVAFSWADLILAAKAQSISQSVSGGMRLDADRASYVGIVAALAVPLRR
jgi:hypothetical protein